MVATIERADWDTKGRRRIIAAPVGLIQNDTTDVQIVISTVLDLSISLGPKLAKLLLAAIWNHHFYELEAVEAPGTLRQATIRTGKN